MRARIYQPSRNAMQSGTAKTREWILEFTPTDRKEIDPLMGWTGSSDTQTQVRLRFNSKEDALSYAQEHGIDVQIRMPNRRKPMIRANG